MGSEAAGDEQLLDRWRNGDSRAGNLLVRKLHPSVHGFFKNSVSDDERLDLVQETFKRLTAAKGGFRGDSGVRAFVLGIARRVLLDHMRKRYRGGDRAGFDPLTHSVEDVHGATPSQFIAELRRSHRLLTCLRALPVDTKQLLELYYWQGCTAAELGHILAGPGDEPAGIPAGTIRRRIHDAKAKLRACLEKAGAASGPPGEGLDVEGDLRALGELLASGPSQV